MDKQLRGVIPPIATPFTDGELDLAALKANIQRWNKTGLGGYLVAGSNGEAVYLDEKEAEAAWAAAKEAAAPGKVIMAGTGRESTRATIAATKRAAAVGADCALVVTPHYFKSQMTPARLKDHFRAVADAADIPILVYNFPQATGLNLEPETVAELAQHPNIAGAKDSSGNIAQMSRLCDLCPDDFALFVGNAEVFYPALCLGAVGGILAVSGCAPEYCVGLQLAFEAGEHSRARALQFAMARLAALVTRIHGVGGLKVAMDAAGYIPGEVRPPLGMPSEEAKAEILAELAGLPKL